MKIIATLILFTIINYPIFGQLKTNIIPKKNNINLFSEYNSTNDTINKNGNIKKNLFTINLEIIGLGFSYGRNIRNSNWFLGVSTGVSYGVPSFYNAYIFDESPTKSAYLYELLYLETAVWYMISKNFSLRMGGKYSLLLWEIKNQKWDDEGCEGAIFNGIYFSPQIGFKTIKIAPKISIIPSCGQKKKILIVYYFPFVINITI